MKNIIILRNKKIKYNYQLYNKFVAGMVLFNNEIKYIRLKNINIINTYCYINNNEIFINNLNIYNNFNKKKYIKRNIKLLLNKYEILKIKKILQSNKYNIIPYKIFLKNNCLAKIVIYICRLIKKNYKKKNNKFKNKNLFIDEYL
ncbi:MAG: SsrA-binding protein [Candidatus Shikimatogenerans sp. Tduv]|uniref:SsrA-binding protein n=1 Tax=Candidatus Shikimatogenerans sp. Tduv TaxID=3158567 RepID=A0AAU7QTK1_9FLAO